MLSSATVKTLAGDDFHLQLAGLQSRIGHHFADPSLLDLALTHSSWAFENAAESNERLELLGDAVLSTCVLQHLYCNHPELDEGQMSQVRSLVVRGSMLATVAARLGFGQALKLGRGEDHIGGRKNPRLLGDTLEAVIAAVYMDAGEQVAVELVVRLLGDAMNAAVVEASATDLFTKSIS